MSLSDDEVREIRRKYDETDVSQSKLAKQYGVTQTNVSLIVRGKTHSDSRGPTSKRQIKKLSDQDVKDMRKLRWDGWTLQELAEEYDVHPSYAGKVTRLDVRSDV